MKHEKGIKKGVDIGRRNFLFSVYLIFDNKSLMQKLLLKEGRVKGTNGGVGIGRGNFIAWLSRKSCAQCNRKMHRNLMLTERKKLYNNSAVAEVAAGLVGDGGSALL